MTASHDDRTTAVGLFNTARSYWHSAGCVNATDLKVTHPQAPVTFLHCHAIELYLKAYLRSKNFSVAQLKTFGHRVADLAKAASTQGLNIETEDDEILSHVENARYQAMIPAFILLHRYAVERSVADHDCQRGPRAAGNLLASHEEQ